MSFSSSMSSSSSGFVSSAIGPPMIVSCLRCSSQQNSSKCRVPPALNARRDSSAAPTDRRRVGGSRFPTWHRGIHIEHEIEIDLGHQPCRLRELVVELSWTPSGVAREDPRARRGTRLEHPTQQDAATWTGRGPVDDRAVFGAGSALRRRRIQPRSGSTGPPMCSGSSLPAVDRRLEPDHLARRACRSDDSAPDRTRLPASSRTAARRSARSSDPAAAASTAAASDEMSRSSVGFSRRSRRQRRRHLLQIRHEPPHLFPPRLVVWRAQNR